MSTISWKPSSKICYDWVKQMVTSESQHLFQEHARHLNTLQAVKSTLNNKSPVKPYFVTTAKKRKNKYAQIKDIEINNANSILLSKMMKIEQDSGNLNHRRIMSTYRPSTPQFHSYRNGQRRRSIENENQIIARRLLQATTHYEVTKIRQSSERQITLRRNISQNSRRSKYLDMTKLSSLHQVTNASGMEEMPNNSFSRSLDVRDGHRVHQQPKRPQRDYIAEQQKKLFDQLFSREQADQSH